MRGVCEKRDRCLPRTQRRDPARARAADAPNLSTHSRVFKRFLSSGVSGVSRANPSFEYAFIFDSRSMILKRSMRVSIDARPSSSFPFSFTSVDAAHPLIESRNFCSFFSTTNSSFFIPV